MVTEKQKQLIFAGVIVLFFIMVALMSGLLQEKPAASSQQEQQTSATSQINETIGFEPRVVMGKADILNTALAIPVKMGGASTFPTINIKDVDYYVIDPVTPGIIGEFDYYYVVSDPGSVPDGYFNTFRLNTDDLAIVEQWMSETGVSLKYTDIPGR